MHRFFIPPDYIAPENVVFPPEQARQIRVVLRMTVGERVLVLDDQGMMYTVELTAVTQKNVIGDIIERQPASGEPSLQITLFQSFLKRDKFELVLQKCTEVGVTTFVPLVTQRTLVQSVEMKANKRSRWQTILTEAAEQSHRGRVPSLETAVTFKTMLTQLSSYDLTLILSAEGNQTLKTTRSSHPSPKKVALLIGPEGGWTEAETAQAIEAGATAVTLGNHVLRTETAAIVASALLLHEWETQ